MLGKSSAFTRKKAITWVVAAAAVIILVIILRWVSAQSTDASTTEGREKFLNSLGWEIDVSTEEYRTVLIPEKFTGVLESYAKMQTEQGYELQKYCGKSCGQYTYTVTNYPNCEDTVLVTLYVCGREVIAGDIHTTSLDGFMHGLKMKKP